MGIRCLLGHDFGGREVERDRREAGDEVVVAYRTVETCERCGSRRVVSENKEIKPLTSPGEATEAAPQESAPATGAPSGAQGAVTATADGAERPESDSSETVAASTGGGGVADATDDAAIILDDTPSSGDAEADASTETPDADVDAAAGTPDTPSPAPDLDAVVESESETELLDDDESTDEDLTVVDDGETELLDDDGDETNDVDSWPAADDDADDGFNAGSPTSGGPTVAADDGDGAPAPWPEEESVERDSNGTKFVRPETETPDRGAVTEFHCPNCAATHATASSSLRSGDVCPDCRKGYLAERQAEGRNA